MIRATTHIATAAIVAQTMWAVTAGADAMPITFDGLVELGIETSIAERQNFDKKFPSYSFNVNTLLNDGVYQMELWGEIDGAMAPIGETVELNAELIGLYDFETRTFTWGWNTDAFPALDRTAALAARAYGETHGIAELTSPTLEGDAGLAGVSANIASVVGDLAFEDGARYDQSPRRILYFGLSQLSLEGNGS